MSVCLRTPTPFQRCLKTVSVAFELSGGNALKFYASMRLEVRRIGRVKLGDEIVGGRTRVKVAKNKFGATTYLQVRTAAPCCLAVLPMLAAQASRVRSQRLVSSV